MGEPTKPIVTRWASWLNAAFWCADNLPKMKDIVLSFENDGLLVERAKSAVSAIDLPGQLMEILH